LIFVGGLTATAGAIWTYFATDNEVEWIAMTLFREYDAVEIADLGCSYAPAGQT